MYQLVNVPTAKSKTEIRGVVEGEHIYIIAAEKDSNWRDGHSVAMTDMYIGSHMFDDPAALRRMVAGALARAIEMARDAGYNHAMFDVCNLIGAQRK